MYCSAFITAVENLCADVEQLTGLEATWKDADPRLWPQLAKPFSQHVHPYCRAAKSKAAGLSICSQHCSYPRPASDHSELHNCPHGVREMRIPLLLGQQYLGTLSLGPWRGPNPKLKELPHLSQLQKLHATLPSKQDQKAQALVRLISARLQQCALLFQPLHSQDQAPNPADSERLQACLSYIQEHLHLQLRAASVARILQLSQSRFIHWFKEMTGMPYRQYIQQEVLKHSASILIHGKQRILDIALDVGYHSASSFAAAFKQHYGVQPSAFKRQMMGLA